MDLFIPSDCRPDTQAYIQKMDEEKRQKEGGKGQDNRSFIAKYVSSFPYTVEPRYNEVLGTMNPTLLYQWNLVITRSDIIKILL